MTLCFIILFYFIYYNFFFCYNFVFTNCLPTGIVKEPDKNGKSYAVFAVTVKKKDQYAEEEEIWDVYRRYSDFHDLHMILTEKVIVTCHLTFIKQMNKCTHSE